jgi:hypothetical protein
MVRKSALGDDLALTGRYEIACVGPDGEIKWRDTIDNLVTTSARPFFSTACSPARTTRWSARSLA